VQPTRPLGEALLDCYKTDAHFACYGVEVLRDGEWVLQPKAPRLTLASLKVLAEHDARAVFGFGVADVDCPEAHREKKAASAEWREQMEILADKVVPGCWRYNTRGGLRILWSWPEPLTPEQFSTMQGHAIAALRAAGIPADDLRDATRCYRLPFVVREGEAQWPDVLIEGDAPAVWMPPGVPLEAPTVAEPSQKSIWDGIETVSDPFKVPAQMEEGTRHNTLKRYAASLRAKSMERDQIEVALREYEAKAGAHLRPYQGTAEGERDLMGIVEWVCGLPAGPSFRSAPRSPVSGAVQSSTVRSSSFVIRDDAFAEVLNLGDSAEVAKFVLRLLEANGVRCVYDLGELWRYVEQLGRYVEVPSDELHRIIYRMSDMLVKGALLKDGTQKYSRLKVSNTFARDVVCIIHTERKQEGFFDQSVGVSFGDCFVRVTDQGIEKHDHSPEWCCNFGYDEPWTDVDPDRYLQFLREILADLSPSDLQIEIETIGEWKGAMLTRQSTTFQKALLIHGGGSNGKSQFVEIDEGLLPKNRISHFSPQALSSDYNKAKLAKALLNATTEVPSTEVSETAAAVVKALISGDPMTARFPYENPFDFVPNTAVLLACNTLPVIRDYSHGMWRRLRLIGMHQDFSGQNRVRNLAKSILVQERIQIVCWAMRQLPALLARGEYRETQVSIDAKAEWRSAGDDVEQWLNDFVEVAPAGGGGTTCDTLYNSYRIWCEGSGVNVMSKRQFFDRLKAKHRPYKAGPAAARRVEYPLLIRAAVVH
jgi:P4 family phage/plasmid primase-like protien